MASVSSAGVGARQGPTQAENLSEHVGSIYVIDNSTSQNMDVNGAPENNGVSKQTVGSADYERHG
tara:strand:+ start:1406 stop:1600 length:195 start_codon:yes stop_codon:yes gene_type:complete